jgi:hypothetical protein
VVERMVHILALLLATVTVPIYWFVIAGRPATTAS